MISTTPQVTSISDLEVTPSGELYLFGTFSSMVDFDPGPGVVSYDPGREYSAYITKYNVDGSYEFTHALLGTSETDTMDLSLDSEDNAYVTGHFYNTVNFDPGQSDDIRSSSDGQDIYFTKINADGTYGYSYVFGGADTDNGRAVAVDKNDENIYVAGLFYQDADFDPTPNENIIVSKGISDAFFSRFNQTYFHFISDLQGGLVTETANGISVDDLVADAGVIRNSAETVIIRDDLGLPISEVVVDFTQDLDWSSISAETNLEDSKAFIHNLVAAPGTADTFGLYIADNPEMNTIVVCPGATTLSEVSLTCGGVYTIPKDDPSIRREVINNINYLVVPNLVGTGATLTFVEELADTETTTLIRTGGY